MGFMKLFEAAVKTVTLPVKAVVDLVDDEVILGDKKSRTRETMGSIVDDIDEIAD